MTIKRVFLVLMLIGLSVSVSAQGESDTNETVKLKLIGYEVDIVETIEVDRNTERIALSKRKVVRIEGLEELPQLTELSLFAFFINSLDWIPKGIKKLNLHFNKLESLDGIEEFTSLEWVYLAANKINNIDSIFKNNSIKELYLAGNKIEIVNCGDNGSIEELDLTGNNIKHIYSLNKLKSLKVLSLYANPIEQNREAINQLREENPGVEIEVREKLEQ